MDSWLPFLSGACVGIVAYGIALDISRARAVRAAHREAIRKDAERAAKLQAISAAMEREMATMMDGLLEAARRAAMGEPTPGCDCEPCKAKRQIAQKARN